LNGNAEVEKIRQVSGHELMLLTGWPKDRLDEIADYSHDQTTSFAGAAFNGFAPSFYMVLEAE
jgi:hypothetical protein